MEAIVTDGDALGGNPRLDGTRIGVVHGYRRYEDGETPEGIAADYDGETVADVHNALAFAFESPNEMRVIEESTRETIERIHEKRPVDPGAFTERA